MSLRNRVLDRVRPVFLDITADDIAAAIADEDKTHNCPGQRAAKRQWSNVFVGTAHIWVRKTPQQDVFALVSGRRAAFTGGDPLADFTFAWDSRTYSGWKKGDSAWPVHPTRIRLHRLDNPDF